MGKELEKEKTVIIDDPMTPVPLNQRQHWTHRHLFSEALNSVSPC